MVQFSSYLDDKGLPEAEDPTFKSKPRATLCISSQIGCSMGYVLLLRLFYRCVNILALGRRLSRVTEGLTCYIGCRCTFCATGTMGLIGHLTAGEILEQLYHANKVVPLFSFLPHFTHPNTAGTVAGVAFAISCHSATITHTFPLMIDLSYFADRPNPERGVYGDGRTA